MGTDPSTADLDEPTDAIAGNITTAELLAADQTRASDIEFAGDKDWYRIKLTAGHTYQIDLGANADSPLDAYLRVLDTSGNELGSNDNTIGANARLSVQVNTGGTYFLSAGGQGTSAGAYTITLGNARPVSTLHITAGTPDGVREGNAGSTKVRFLVTRTGNTSQETTATWTILNDGGIVLSSRFGANSAVSATTMTFIAPVAAVTVADMAALVTEPMAVLMGPLPGVRATIDTTMPAVHGGMGGDLHLDVVLAMARVDGLG